jgi:hypothetical protein
MNLRELILAADDIKREAVDRPRVAASRST